MAKVRKIDGYLATEASHQPDFSLIAVSLKRLLYSCRAMRLRSFLGCLVLFCTQPFVFAQTFSFTGPLAIPDDGSWKSFPLQVQGLPAVLDTVTGLQTVCFSIGHQYVSDLTAVLVSPQGRQITLFDGVGGDGNDFIGTILGNYTLPRINNGSAPFSGTFSAQQSLGLFNTGQASNGTWVLKIKDNYQADEGVLQNWCLSFGTNPARIFPFLDSNLPVLVIQSGLSAIVDEPKTDAILQVLEPGPNGRTRVIDSAQVAGIKIGIELRGSSSQGFPKKSFGFECRDMAGEDSAVSLLGLPAESDWVLTANYSDKSLMRNAFAYYLAREMGRYAPRTRFVELILNDEYQGVYVLTEKIKRDASRVDISKLKPTDTTGANLTGGYIFKIDKTTGNDNEGFYSSFAPEANASGQAVLFLYDYPKAEDLHPSQKAYIQAYVDSFERAVQSVGFADPVSGWRKFAHEASFVDMLLVNEWSRNTDGYRISTYFTKPKISQNGGKLLAGPVWDYDLAFRNANYCNGQNTSGWAYDFPLVCPDDSYQPPVWWRKFRTDPAFNATVKCRWTQLISDLLPTAKRNLWIDSVQTLLTEAATRNFAYWPILGQYVWPNPDPIPTTYTGEINAFRNWLSNRQAWITANIGGSCVTEVDSQQQLSVLELFPNPAEDFFSD